MLNKIRDRLNPWIEATAKPFVQLGLSPNHISFIALSIGILAGLLFSFQRIRYGGILVLIGGYFDVIDGAVARLTGKVTEFGGVLDSVSDRISDAALFIGIAAGGFGSFGREAVWFLPILALLGSLMVSYVRARAESAGTGKLDVGIAERAERLLILAAGALLNLIPYALAAIVILTTVTVFQRIREAYLRLD